MPFPFDDVFRGMVDAGLGIEALCEYLQLSRLQLEGHLVRLGLASPLDRPARKGTYKAWSVWEVVRLIAWRMAGVHPEIIGIKLGNRSAGSVRSKCRRLGLKAPPRKLLHKPKLNEVRDPETGFAWRNAATTAIRTPLLSTCGHVAGRVTWRSREEAKEGNVSQLSGQAAVINRTGGSRSVVGQRELTLFGVVGGSEHQPSNPVAAKSDHAAKLRRAAIAQAAPKTEAEVNFSADLTWIGKIRRPLTNKVVVWVCGMLVMGGLHYKEAAKRVGMKPGAFRTFRTRSAIPVDDDRRKFSNRFGETLARDTLAHSGYMLRECASASETRDGRGNWFWVGRHDRFTRFSPPKRKRDHDIEGRFNRIRILTGADAKLTPKRITPPFAKSDGSIGCNSNSWSAAHA